MGERDPGERRWFDHVVGYAHRRPEGGGLEVAVGSLRPAFGQGLLFGRGRSMGVPVPTPRRDGEAVGYRSAAENRHLLGLFLRGRAAGASDSASWPAASAGTPASTTPAPPCRCRRTGSTTGTRRAWRDRLAGRALGARATTGGEGARLGITIQHLTFGRFLDLRRPGRVPEAFAGRGQAGAAIDGLAGLGKARLFASAAVAGGRPAWVAGINGVRAAGVRFDLLARDSAPGFFSPFGASVLGGGSGQRGLTARVRGPRLAAVAGRDPAAAPPAGRSRFRGKQRTRPQVAAAAGAAPGGDGGRAAPPAQRLVRGGPRASRPPSGPGSGGAGPRGPCGSRRGWRACAPAASRGWAWGLGSRRADAAGGVVGPGHPLPHRRLGHPDLRVRAGPAGNGQHPPPVRGRLAGLRPGRPSPGHPSRPGGALAAGPPPGAAAPAAGRASRSIWPSRVDSLRGRPLSFGGHASSPPTTWSSAAASPASTSPSWRRGSVPGWRWSPSRRRPTPTRSGPRAASPRLSAPEIRPRSTSGTPWRPAPGSATPGWWRPSSGKAPDGWRTSSPWGCGSPGTTACSASAGRAATRPTGWSTPTTGPAASWCGPCWRRPGPRSESPTYPGHLALDLIVDGQGRCRGVWAAPAGPPRRRGRRLHGAGHGPGHGRRRPHLRQHHQPGGGHRGRDRHGLARRGDGGQHGVLPVSTPRPWLTRRGGPS